MTGRGHGTPTDLSAVLSVFRLDARLSRSDVMSRTGLARSTVNQRIDALLDAGLLASTDVGQSTGGRPPGLFEFNRYRGVLLVADVGATAMRIALCDLSGAVLGEHEVLNDVADGPELVLTRVSDHFSELLSVGGRRRDDVLGIGVDVPGPVDFATGRVVNPPIMTGWDRFDIPGWFRGRFTCPVVVDKDVNAMAVGEFRAVYPDITDLLVLKVGTGVGSGLVINGSIHRGADGAAGDIGHIQLSLPDEDGGPLCRCGNRGCVEAYAGGWAIARDLRAAGRDVSSVDDVIDLIRTGDVQAQQLLRRAGRILGRAVADAVNLVNPRVIAVCGQLAHTDDHLLAGIREIVYRRSLPLATGNLQIVRTKLGARAGVIGLASLVTDKVFSPARLERLLT